MGWRIAQLDAAGRLHFAIQRLERWKSLGEALIENDPNADAADGVSCLDVWRKEAALLLREGDPPTTLHQCPCGHEWEDIAVPGQNNQCPSCNPITRPKTTLAEAIEKARGGKAPPPAKQGYA